MRCIDYLTLTRKCVTQEQTWFTTTHFGYTINTLDRKMRNTGTNLIYGHSFWIHNKYPWEENAQHRNKPGKTFQHFKDHGKGPETCLSVFCWGWVTPLNFVWQSRCFWGRINKRFTSISMINLLIMIYFMVISSKKVEF